MNAEIRSILTDIKAAARIGHAESLWLALDGLLDLPQVNGNPLMNDAFLQQAILPIGFALSHPRLAPSLLQPLAVHAQAALRAVTGVAWAARYFDKGDISQSQLEQIGKDARGDVRQAFRFALAEAGAPYPEKLLALAADWMASPSPRQQAVAISLLPALPDQAFELLSNYAVHSDPDVRAALVDTLTQLALAGQADKTLALLDRLARSQENNVWLITRTLSGSWAANYPEASLAILAVLGTQNGPNKQIKNALQALERHGAQDAVHTALEHWRIGKQPNLQAIAVQFHGNQTLTGD